MKSLRTILKPLSPSSSPSKSQPSDEMGAVTHAPHAIASLVSTSALSVIELFQSQGCNSCPPANNFCIALFPLNDRNHLLLTYEVTYWDHLGWRDTFGDARWDARQRDYATVLGQRTVYTPQVIVDGGARPLGGNGWRNLPAILDQERRVEHEALMLVVGEGERSVRVSGGGKRYGEVLAVAYEAQPEDVKISRGENKGETLPHRNVVRNIQVIGIWEGEEEQFDLPALSNGFEMAVLVQAGRGGEILGAVRV